MKYIEIFEWHYKLYDLLDYLYEQVKELKWNQLIKNIKYWYTIKFIKPLIEDKFNEEILEIAPYFYRKDNIDIKINDEKYKINFLYDNEKYIDNLKNSNADKFIFLYAKNHFFYPLSELEKIEKDKIEYVVLSKNEVNKLYLKDNKLLINSIFKNK